MKHLLKITALALFAGLWAGGCSPAAPPAAAPSGGAPAPSSASTPAPEGKPTEAGVEALEAKLKAAPEDAALKEQTAEANYQLGHTMMLDPELPPRVKYRGALKYFRRTLALNPKHAQAASERKVIEDIYVQMGMPIPQ